MKATPYALILAAVGWHSSTFAAQVTCYEDPATEARQCFSPSEVREKDGIRTAPLYTGGPNAVHPTGYAFALNCQTNVMHLKDKDGVSFAGADAGATPGSQSLFKWICAVPLKKK
jgi:hypothetical protein